LSDVPQEINYDSTRGGVSVITEKGDITTSYLLIQRARAPDTGRYACNPTNANEQTVMVHVLNGKLSPFAITCFCFCGSHPSLGGIAHRRCIFFIWSHEEREKWREVKGEHFSGTTVEHLPSIYSCGFGRDDVFSGAK